MFLRYVLLWMMLALGASRQVAAQASYLTRIPDPKTLGQTYVSDPDRLLQPATVRDLNELLRALDQSRRAHIDVALTRSIGEEVPKTAATALFNRWQIGDRELRNGLLLLIVEDQRRVEIETGYGLEADLPDILCFRVQQRYMVPYLRQGQYDAAVRQGVAALIRQLTTGRLEPADSLATASTDDALALTDDPAAPETAIYASSEPGYPTAWSTGEAIGVGLGLVFLLVTGGLLLFNLKPTAGFRWGLGLAVAALVGLWFCTLLLDLAVPAGVLVALCYAVPLLGAHVYLWQVQQRMAAMAGQSRHARYVFLSEALHGLGMLRYVFPLGLVWMWPRQQRHLAALRDEPYACPSCAHPMHRLDETQDDATLQPGQVAEERVASVDYDAWQCPACQQQLLLPYANLATDAKACIMCRYHTAQPQPDEVMEEATTSHGGWGWHVWHCAFCQHTQRTKYTTARLSSSGSSSGSSGSSSGGSWSSSSGGSSGGGGAGSSW
ncbi:TPM domain-containing protein [Hymenobacter yonginensis]|uniref:TPM domain-containing protein n=1 Tax=Hymenobacter yonginensis TaxID=748197 RepID=A0ABY7PNL4_9BACT|nr:TPM domain-containing protein [Hymenobacter yonginensis]WBO83768.1 TPM domain-containing protein [Hymenobacter yonginensis]